MPEFKIDSKEIVEFLVEYLELDEFKASVSGLKDIDWNPFDEDGDEHEGAWAEITNNYDLVWDVLVDLVGIAEAVVIGGVALTNKQKHKAVVDALDRALDAPWYIEPFDNAAIGMLVSSAVKFMNAMNWGIGEGYAIEKIELAVDHD